MSNFEIKIGHLKVKLILLSILFSSNIHSACLDNAYTTLNISDCYMKELAVAEYELRNTLNDAYKESNWIADEIKQSQSDWLKYRESHCSAIYKSYGNGTMRLIAHPSCMVDLTKERQNQIYVEFVKGY